MDDESTFRRLVVDYVVESIGFRKLRQADSDEFMSAEAPDVKAFMHNIPGHTYAARRLSNVFSQAVVALATDPEQDIDVADNVVSLSEHFPSGLSELVAETLWVMAIEVEAMSLAAVLLEDDDELEIADRDLIRAMWRVDVETEARAQLALALVDESVVEQVASTYQSLLVQSGYFS